MGNRLLRPLVTVVLLLLATANVATARSLYAIAQTVSYDARIPINAYDIAPDGTVTLQTQYTISTAGTAGAVGLAADPKSKYLFVTFQSSNRIGLLDPVRMTSDGRVTLAGARDLAGIVYDCEKELLYCVDRGTPKLYVLEWDAAAAKLTPVSGSPFDLEDAEAFGLALDEAEDRLYVGGAGDRILVYSTADWRLVRTIQVIEPPISVAVDSTRKYLYYGGGYLENFYLTRFDLTTGTKKQVLVDPHAGVLGLGVDRTTGHVYITTGRNNQWCCGHLFVFNSNLVRVQAVRDIGNPWGLVIPNGDVPYNPLRLTKTVKGFDGDKAGDDVIPYATIGEEITYYIRFEHADLRLTNVVAVDRLPQEIAFERATWDNRYGQYDPNTHTYTWKNPPLSEDGTTCLELVGRVKPDTAVGQAIRNWVTLTTQEMPPTTADVEVIAIEGRLHEPLNVRKTVIVKGVEAVPPVYVSPGEQITYRISLDNKRNQETVADVFLIDELPDEVEFGSATGDNFQYEPITRTCVWSYPWLLAGESDTVDVVVRVSDKVAAGTTITNTATVEGEQTQPNAATASVVVNPASLRLNKTVVDARPDSDGRIMVSPGDIITYALEYSNPPEGKPVADVVIVDDLPDEVSFVSATGDRDYGWYDATGPTYTWSLAPLAPGAEGRLELVVRVNKQVAANTVISNNAVIRGRETLEGKARADVIVRKPDDPIEPGEPTYAFVYMRPDRLYRSDPRPAASVMVVVHLPQGMGKGLIADTPLVLTPGDVRPKTQQIFGTTDQGKVMAFFDPQAILNAIDGIGSFPVQITGKFRDGNSFIGNDVLYIFDKP